MQVGRWAKRRSRRTCATPQVLLNKEVSVKESVHGFASGQYIAIVLDDSDGEDDSLKDWLDAKSIYQALATPAAWRKAQRMIINRLEA